MSIDNLPGEQPGPVDDAPKSEDELISDISDLLDDDPETDPAKGNEDQAKAAPADDGDEPDIDVTEDVEDEADAEVPDGSQDEIKGGRFAPDSAKVTLADGSVITVSELKRNNLFQRDYTKKTTELAAEREQITARKSEVDQQAQSLTQLAERLTAVAQKYLPKPPDPFTGSVDSDPIGYMRFMQQKAAYDEAMAEFNGIEQGKSQLTEAQQREQAMKAQEANNAEAAQLIERDKYFADPRKVQSFLEEAVSIGGEAWGLSQDDLAGLASHKHFLILRDALRYRKALAKAPKVQEQVRAKPAVAIGGRRADPGTKVSAEKQARSERLRRDGSFQNGVAALMDLDL